MIPVPRSSDESSLRWLERSENMHCCHASNLQENQLSDLIRDDELVCGSRHHFPLRNLRARGADFARTCGSPI